MRPAHLRLFYDTAAWNKYREHVRHIIEPKGVEYVDASHWISDEALFDDPLHMGMDTKPQSHSASAWAISSRHEVIYTPVIHS